VATGLEVSTSLIPELRGAYDNEEVPFTSQPVSLRSITILFYIHPLDLPGDSVLTDYPTIFLNAHLSHMITLASQNLIS
jgi:hypothetical protein